MKKKRKSRGIVGSAIDAAEELGQAAIAVKATWDHMQSARSKGEEAMRPIRRARRRATSTVRSVARRTTQAIKKRK